MAATLYHNQCFGNPQTHVGLVWGCGGATKRMWRILQDERFILVVVAVVVNIINMKTETETTSETSWILNNEHA
jgi:hypothetical protein